MIAIVELVCATCGKLFNRQKAEAERNAKKGRKSFCSIECSLSNSRKFVPKTPPGGARHLRQYNVADEFTPVRYHFRNAKRHSQMRRELSFMLTLQDLKVQWDKQAGICPVTGWKMTPRCTSDKGMVLDHRRASLDRIDPSKGYEVGNIRFVCHIANMAKGVYTDSQLQDFCLAVVENLKGSQR